MFSAQNQMKRVWDEKLGPSRHLKRESDIPLSHHNWLTGGPGSGGGEVLQKSMFPESRVKGEYMFLDFINKYFIQLSMVWMWWKRTLSCHSGFWMGRWYVWGKIEATKGYQQESARKDSNLNDRQRVELCAFFFIPPDSTAEGVQQSWSGVWQQLVALLWAVTGKRIYNSKQTLALNFTEDQTSTYNRPITTPDSSDTERQYLFYESKTHTLRSNKKHENGKLLLYQLKYPAKKNNSQTIMAKYGRTTMLIFAHYCYTLAIWQVPNIKALQSDFG